MRRVIVSEFVSLDGVIEDPGGSGESDRGGWSFQADRGAEGDKFKFDELAAADALLLGRVTYEGFAAAWPQMEEQTGEYGAWMNGYPKHVASSRSSSGRASAFSGTRGRRGLCGLWTRSRSGRTASSSSPTSLREARKQTAD
jgi:hypothetical protein